MLHRRNELIALAVLWFTGLTACQNVSAPGLPAEEARDIKAFLGARILDGTGA